ncbi:MAG: PTS lactose/cellobiose transporter subunit IIA [Planctomycetaceae bacterium]|nr:PTS lactose/cellobiose transporter subunit IIA [Planctomycetaceae bacterium]
MEKKRTVSLFSIGLAAAAVIIVVTTLSLLPIRSVQAKEPNTPAMSKPMSGCTMGDMNKCMADCMKKCQANMENVSAAKTSIMAAIEAIDKGDTKTAKIEMEKADKLLANVHKCMKENMQQMPCCNVKCPIMGEPINAMKCPKELTRMYKGEKVGFCCAGCPEKWDKLTDTEKDAKLKDAMPSMK